MDYCRCYDRLIERARTRVLDGYVERHHILPRCMGGSDDPDNLVRLTPEEHYLAHQLLVKMYPEHPNLIWAAHMMAARPGNKLYGWLRRSMSATRRGRKQSPEHIAKLSAVRKGRPAAESQKRAASEALTGITRSAETRARMSEAAKRRGISPEVRAAATAAARKPKGPMSEQRKENIRAAKLASAYKHSDETKAKMKVSHTGHKLSPEHRAAIGAALLGKVRGPYKTKGV